MERLCMMTIGCVLLMMTIGQTADRATQIRDDREMVEGEGLWIYNDLPTGFAEAERTGKPLLIVFR